MLETYADASVVRGVGSSGRLHRDDPAVMTLPRSGITAFATRHVALRAAAPGRRWPARCDSYRAYARWSAMPAALRARLPNDPRPTPRYRGRWSIILHADVPLSMLTRFMDTCARHIGVFERSPGTYELTFTAPSIVFRVLSRVMQSGLAEELSFDRERRAEPD